MSHGYSYNHIGKLRQDEIEEILKTDENIRVLSPADFQITDRPDRKTLESRVKTYLLKNEAEIKGFFRTREEDDFLILVITDKEQEAYILGHPRVATLKHFIADSDIYRGKTIDIGPINEVYEKLKNNEDKTKYQSVLKGS